MTHGHGTTEGHAAYATREFDNGGNIRELHRALLSTQGVEEFLREMAMLAARLVSGGAAEARLAENFAENASSALSLAIKLASHAALIEQLRSSLASRGVIDQALGIIMARDHCTQDRAFAILRSASQNSNVKLRAIARAVVTSVTGEPPRPAPPFEEGC